MTHYRLFFFYTLLLSISTFSCRKSAPACGTLGWSLAIQDELNNLSAATTAYSQNASHQNCEAYKQAYIDYIDALKGLEKCLINSIERADWQHSLDLAEQEVNNIQC
jgi:hypothetical protein